jgi:uncharacterized protein
MAELSEERQNLARTAAELQLGVEQVRATAALLADGATVPFIARYRKEVTGSLDEVAIAAIRDRLVQLDALDQRRHAILGSLEERGLLTPELRRELASAATTSALEDLYQPFRPRRRTRASTARERGLEPLADLLLRQQRQLDPNREAARFVTPPDRAVEAGLRVESIEIALQGARDIIAERVSDDPEARDRIRRLFWSGGTLTARVRTGKEAAGAKYAQYFDWSEPVRTAPSHRVLAVFRGEAEQVLRVDVEPPESDAVRLLEQRFVSGTGAGTEQVRLAVVDGYRRLLARSMEAETRAELKQRADAGAIRIFAQNLQQLLLAPPLGQKRVLAIDPGLRTGCKVVVLDAQGQLLGDAVIFPDAGQQRRRDAADTIARLVAQHQVEAIAIGNGTGGRETEAFIRQLELPTSLPVVTVNEAGASVYSASSLARAEFPDRDITVRGAVSIGRRLMDPLAELVKIDPKSIGVGQYQHDVDQADLKHALDDVVISCVNAVGVEVNTASSQLLAYVSGLGPAVADNIVSYRNQHGPFTRRRDLLRVPRLGEKAFEQSAGFLRIRGANNPLDATAVHPESYPVVDRMASDLGVHVGDLLASEQLRQQIDLRRYVMDQVGLPTLRDVVAELANPGRDPRQRFDVARFQEGVRTLDDLQEGMRLPGVVTNVTAFGAFVDIGVHRDGLVHISELADRFVRDPSEVVRVQQPVEVTVLAVDRDRGRIALSMRRGPSSAT